MSKLLGSVIRTPSEVANGLGLDPSLELPVPSGGRPATRHVDGFVQTLLFADQMERILSSLRSEVRSSLDETGVNPLFCVFGFLEWFEAEASEVPLYAPLLLQPLEIERELIRGNWDYRVKSSGESPTINVALAEKLKKHGFSNETQDSIKSKLKRGTFAATFLLACLAALELEGIRLEDI